MADTINPRDHDAPRAPYARSTAARTGRRLNPLITLLVVAGGTVLVAFIVGIVLAGFFRSGVGNGAVGAAATPSPVASIGGSQLALAINKDAHPIATAAAAPATQSPTGGNATQPPANPLLKRLLDNESAALRASNGLPQSPNVIVPAPSVLQSTPRLSLPVTAPAPQSDDIVVQGADEGQPQQPAVPALPALQGVQPANAPSLVVKSALEERANRRSAFAGANGGPAPYLDSQEQIPAGKYELARTVPVTCQLDDAVTTSESAPVTAHILYDIRSTDKPYPIVIPHGSWLSGEANIAVENGDQKLAVVWNILTFPDLRFLDLQRMPSSDPNGEAGLSAQVDDHRGRAFTITFLSAILGAGLQISQPQQNTSVGSAPSAGQIIAGAAGAAGNQTAQQLLATQAQRPPTLTVKKGREFIIRLRSSLLLDDYYATTREKQPGRAQ